MKKITSQAIELYQSVQASLEVLLDLPLEVATKQVNEDTDLSQQQKQKLFSLLKRAHTQYTLMEISGQKKLAKYIRHHQDLSGQHLGGYQLLKLLSVGGMSAVYLAERTDGSIQKKVAIKVLPPWMKSKQSLALFNHEQTILSKLRHPNIVTMHHGGTTDEGVYYTVMDFLERATPLDEYIRSHDLSQREVIKLAITIANAIHYAHGHLIIHRDLKAGNVLIDDLGHLYVVDFGIASLAEDQHEEDPRVYTPEIASPEQILGERITVRSDVFSLAATVLSQLLGCPALPQFDPKNYQAKNDQQHVEQVLSESGLPKPLRVVFAKALQVDVEQRYSTMEALAQDWQHWLNHRPVRAMKHHWWQHFGFAMRRNPIAATLSAMLAVIVFISGYLVLKSVDDANSAFQKSEATLSFLTGIIRKADPFQSKAGNVSIKEVLDSHQEINIEQLNGDWALKARLHEEMGHIYQNLGLFSSAVEHYQQELLTRLTHLRDDLDGIHDVRNRLASAYSGVGDVAQSIEQASLVLADRAIAREDQLLLAETNLMKAYGVEASVTSEHVADFERIRTKLLGAIKETVFADLAERFFVISALAVAVQKSGDYEMAERLFEESVRLVTEVYGPESREYHSIQMDYAIMLIRNKKHLQAEEKLKELINSISTMDPLNTLLGRVWETYATLLKRNDELEASLEALNHAVKIFNTLENQEGQYVSLSKRAMYRYEAYQFKAGVFDQIRAFHAIRSTAGDQSPITLAASMIMSFMLYSLNEPDMGGDVIGWIFRQIEGSEVNANTINAFTSYAAIMLWLEDNKAQAQAIYEQAEVPEQDARWHYFQTLMADGIPPAGMKPIVITSKSQIWTRLTLLENWSAGQIILEDVDLKVCELTNNFHRTRIIVLKEELLNHCLQLYAALNLTPPDEWQQIQANIEQARMAFTHEDRLALKQLVKRYLLESD